MNGDWNFLYDWFDTIASKGVGCNADGLDDLDDIRVGRDARDASWIELTLGREELDPLWGQDSDDDSSDDGFFGSEQQWLKKPIVRETLRSLREAIVLTSVVAQVDYHGWLQMLRDNGGFDVPPHWLVPDESGQLPTIPVRFKLMLENANGMDFLDWSATFRHLLGTDEYSEEYEADLAQLRKVLEMRGIPWARVEPTPIIIRLAFNGELYVSNDIRGRLLRLTDAVTRTNRILEYTTNGSRGLLVQIEALEIDFLRTEIHDHILEALIVMLQCGVPVPYLRLPQLQSQLPSLATWTTFIRLLLGVDDDDYGRLASVRRIIIPAAYAGVYHFAPLCSALAYARGVDVIHFAGSKHPDGTDAFGADGKRDRDHVWRWLAFALLSKASQCSATRLILDGERPLPRDTETIKTIMNSASPLLMLYEASYVSETPPIPVSVLKASTAESAIVPKWSVLRLFDGDRGDTDCQTKCDLPGQWLATHPTTGEALLFVPGYGFCLMDEVERSSKRQKPSTEPLIASSAFESIVFTPGQQTTMNSAALELILNVIGPRLRSLRFTLDSTEKTIHAVFASCPNLHSLAVTGLSLTSMEVLDQGYKKGAKITSLSLGHVVTTEKSALAFVCRLADKKSAMAQTLERIYWGVQVRELPGQIIKGVSDFETVMEHNTRLTHVSGVAPELLKFHAKRIPGRTPAQEQQLVAFLGAMRLTCGGAVDELVRRQIWEFAEELRFRSVAASEW